MYSQMMPQLLAVTRQFAITVYFLLRAEFSDEANCRRSFRTRCLSMIPFRSHDSSCQQGNAAPSTKEENVNVGHFKERLQSSQSDHHDTKSFMFLFKKKKSCLCLGDSENISCLRKVKFTTALQLLPSPPDELKAAVWNT